MKEEIYTIPVNEAYENDCECPLCWLEQKLENEAVDYALGAAMMEPDYRIKSNEKGFCNRHFSQMMERTNKLSLALILDTHLEEIRKKLSGFEKELSKVEKNKGGLFKKSGIKEFSDSLSDILQNVNGSCEICDRINYTMERYIRVMFFMWNKDDEFKEKFKKSKGFCMKHFQKVVEASGKALNDKQETEFLNVLMQKQIKEFQRIQDDIHRFTLKFDYRNRDMEWGTAEDAPIRTVEKIAGFLHVSEEK